MDTIDKTGKLRAGLDAPPTRVVVHLRNQAQVAALIADLQAAAAQAWPAVAPHAAGRP